MSETSRRSFIAATGAGAATAVTLGGATHASAARAHPDAATESVVAYVKNHKTGELRLLVGEREVVVHDRDLVTRILNAAGGK